MSSYGLVPILELYCQDSFYEVFFLGLSSMSKGKAVPTLATKDCFLGLLGKDELSSLN
jgi:hypothetical protein